MPGDVLILSEGDTVAADARLVSAATLKVSEASLTGESEPVLKDARTLPGPVALGDRLDMVFNGTAVTQGVGRAVVTVTGMSTQMGQIADLFHATHEDPTPLQREIAGVSRMLGRAVIVIAVVVVATVFAFFGVHTVHDVVTTLLLGVSLAVAAVPEGLPTILSVVLAPVIASSPDAVTTRAMVISPLVRVPVLSDGQPHEQRAVREPRDAGVVGLIYVLIWESLVGSFVPGAQVLSIQQWALAVTARVLGSSAGTLAVSSAVSFVTGVALLAVVVAGCTWFAGTRLRTLQLTATE